MEKTVEKEELQAIIQQNPGKAIEVLYSGYSNLLLGFILQFIPDKNEAEKVLMLIFDKLYSKLNEIDGTPLSIFSWLQIQSRKIILEYKNENVSINESAHNVIGSNGYVQLLHNASEIQRKVFIEMYINGYKAQEVASQMNIETALVQQLLRESLIIMRKNML